MTHGRELVPGAPPPDGGIGLAVPQIGEHERELVDESLRSGWVAYGPFVDRFEEEVRRRLGVAHAVAVASGSAALHLALLAVGVEPDDEVAVSTLTFISPGFAIRYAGAWPVCIDAEPECRQIDVEALEGFLRDECERRGAALVRRSTGRRVGAIVGVDLLGHPADCNRIRALAAEYGLPYVEDAAEALGATLDGRPAGSFGDVGCLSFNGNKIVTAGSGGMVVTNDTRIAERVRYLATQAKDDPLEYVHGEVGFNYRMSNVHAALGYGQLLRLEEFVAAKRRIAATYTRALQGVAGVDLPLEAPGVESTFWLYTVRIRPDAYGVDSRGVLRRLQAEGVQTRPLWQPLHRSPSLRHVPPRACPVADDLYATCLSLPCSTGLSEAEQERVIDLISQPG